MNRYLNTGAVRAVAILCVTASLGACATVTRGTSEAFVVQTDPGGASVKTNIGFACDQTPCTFKMPRKSDFDVTIAKPGYVTVNTHVTHHTASGGAAGMAGNVLVGGLIGIGVDATSGATQDIIPNPLIVKLEVDAKAAAKVAEAK
ncbi:MAG: translation initiation factor 2, gamma subunit, GTPase [Caulobacteraceae bacterium]|nr:translation initiation factor 2, gamma subunit, GTPase [Caulobacteraceae bacterium]